MAEVENLLRDLPDPDGARRFFEQLREKAPSEANKLLKNPSLLADVLTLAAYSPLLGTTLLQNTAYFNWLKRHRHESRTRAKEELLESLARFSLTNSEVEPQILLARFRRRELLRIYLRDIRRLGTIAEITEEISNLADAILEYALRLAQQTLDNRYGAAQETDEKGRARAAQFCIVSLGKLGSKELNYSSDIDLLFLYSAEGQTSGAGARGATTNREYFTRLAELVTKIVGEQSGEGAAYRVDLRLRPHGRVGALAVSASDAVKYYSTAAQAWERQTLIRARASAGAPEVFSDFYAAVKAKIYAKEESVENALRNVRLSKEKINLEHGRGDAFNVKLGAGGIREIEFIAQALQLAHGGRDRWLRAPHTLKSLARLADRGLIGETDLTELADAYDFLRRLEHHLQMEHGLQTHSVPPDAAKRLSVARKMNCRTVADFDARLETQTANVNRLFKQVFGDERDGAALKVDEAEITPSEAIAEIHELPPPAELTNSQASVFNRVLTSLEKSAFKLRLSRKKIATLERFCAISPYFAEMLIAVPNLIKYLPHPADARPARDYFEFLGHAVEKEKSFAGKLSALRRYWAKAMLEIAADDAFGSIDRREAKNRQTALAEASLRAAGAVAETEIARRYAVSGQIRFAALGLGKLGGGGMDYGSDLDLVLIYDDASPAPAADVSPAEFYTRYAEVFIAALANFTRDGNLYRVDLRLRPDGKNGAIATGKNAFLNYLQERAAIWEWLAYVKLRGAGGDFNLAIETERAARRIIHENAVRGDEEGELKNETRRVRERLEREKTKKSKEIDIKFGAGGMLDVYFAARYLQLRDGFFDDERNRSTLHTLRQLYENGSLTKDEYAALDDGYDFLGALDHNLRLTVGRSNSLPLANPEVLRTLIARMNLASVGELMEELTLHRLNIRRAYENILK